MVEVLIIFVEGWSLFDFLLEIYYRLVIRCVFFMVYIFYEIRVYVVKLLFVGLINIKIFLFILILLC